MSGVMAGSAILSAQVRRDSLAAVTLTINNSCNLSCQHCYLQYGGPAGLIPPSLIDHVFEADFELLCIVGKEPLANAGSIALVSSIAERTRKAGRAFSIVTNGLNGELLSPSVLEAASWIDVSIDGGSATYAGYRGGSWDRLRRSIDAMRVRGLDDLRVLQTLSSATVESLPDMIATAQELGATLTMFSPYQPTRSAGAQTVSALSPIEYVSSLGPYRNDMSVHISFDVGYASHFGDSASAVERAFTLFGDRCNYLDSDPIDRGLIRVTYDGLVLTPFEAIHTNDYQQVGRPAMDRGLREWFDSMLACATAAV